MMGYAGACRLERHGEVVMDYILPKFTQRSMFAQNSGFVRILEHLLQDDS